MLARTVFRCLPIPMVLAMSSTAAGKARLGGLCFAVYQATDNCTSEDLDDGGTNALCWTSNCEVDGAEWCIENSVGEFEDELLVIFDEDEEEEWEENPDSIFGSCCDVDVTVHVCACPMGYSVTCEWSM